MDSSQLENLSHGLIKYTAKRSASQTERKALIDMAMGNPAWYPTIVSLPVTVERRGRYRKRKYAGKARVRCISRTRFSPNTAVAPTPGAGGRPYSGIGENEEISPDPVPVTIVPPKSDRTIGTRLRRFPRAGCIAEMNPSTGEKEAQDCQRLVHIFLYKLISGHINCSTPLRNTAIFHLSWGRAVSTTSISNPIRA